MEVNEFREFEEDIDGCEQAYPRIGPKRGFKDHYDCLYTMVLRMEK